MGVLKDKVQRFGLNKVIHYLEANPEENMPKILDWVEKLDKYKHFEPAEKQIRQYISDPNNNWNIFIKSFFTEIDEGVRKKLFENFIVNAGIIGCRKRKEKELEQNCNVPWTLLLDPTSACNLHCTGCWAAEYGDKLSLSLEELDDIILQGKAMGMRMFIFSGGEPLVRKSDIIKLCEKHSDSVFLAFTNATLIDEDFANEMLRVKNFIPAISIEGFEEETDLRRGTGTYKKVTQAMDLLKSKKLVFGFSTCYHSKNADVIGSESYFDEMISRGCKFGWIFTYMPVGTDADIELMASAEQRAYMYEQVRKFRKTKPIFTMDFWNDGEYIDGCIAGGRYYLHINANGDIEPCAFIHYADSNIKEKTLLEALKSPLFMQYRENQPFNENMLRPCPLLDNPGRLAEMVHKSNAYSTDLRNPEDVDQLTEKCVDAANNWKEVADKLWEKS